MFVTFFFCTMIVTFVEAKRLVLQHAPKKMTPKQKSEYFWTFESKAIEGLVRDLKSQTSALKKEAKDVNALKTRLETEKAEILKIRESIDAMRAQLSNKLIEVQQSELKNIKKLAATYTNIDPSAAVKIFNEMDDVFAVKVMSCMAPDSLGAVLQAMVNAGKNDARMAKRAVQLSDSLRMLTLQQNTTQ